MAIDESTRAFLEKEALQAAYPPSNIKMSDSVVTFKERREAELLSVVKEYDVLPAIRPDGTVDITYLSSGTVREAGIRAIGSMLDEILASVKERRQ